jgi:hypothetical protein
MSSTAAQTAQTATATKTRKSRATRAADAMTATATAPDSAAVAAALTAAGVSEADIATMLKSTAPKPPKMNVKRTVGNALIKAAADVATGWEHDEITRETATELICRWVSYVPSSEWDDRLGTKSDAGRRPKADETDETEIDES